MKFYNDIAFRVPAVLEAVSHSEAGGNTFMYYREYPSGIERYGACHDVEPACVFNNLDETAFTGENPGETLAAQVQGSWTNFAKTGNAGIEGVEWPQYDATDRVTMIIGETWRVVNDLLRKQRELIEPLIPYDIK